MTTVTMIAVVLSEEEDEEDVEVETGIFVWIWYVVVETGSGKMVRSWAGRDVVVDDIDDGWRSITRGW